MKLLDQVRDVVRKNTIQFGVMIGGLEEPTPEGTPPGGFIIRRQTDRLYATHR